MQYSRGYESDYASWPWALEAIERCGRCCGKAIRIDMAPPHPSVVVTPPNPSQKHKHQELRARRGAAPGGGGADPGGALPGGPGLREGGGGGGPGAARGGAARPASLLSLGGSNSSTQWEWQQGVALLPDARVLRPHVLRRAPPPAPPNLDADAHAGVALRGGWGLWLCCKGKHVCVDLDIDAHAGVVAV